MAIVVTLLLALIVGGVAQVLVADLEIGRLALWDTTAQYLAQAGLEHQIYLLKANKNAGAIADTNFPATTDQRGWFRTSLACTLNCTGNPAARRWAIRSSGELRRYHPDGTWTVLQTRTLFAEVDIAYGGTTPLYGAPLRVTVATWEEVLP
jgi:hypothetical protein